MTGTNENLIKIISKAQNGGGKKRIELQHKKGKLSARERINLLFFDIIG